MGVMEKTLDKRFSPTIDQWHRPEHPSKKAFHNRKNTWGPWLSNANYISMSPPVVPPHPRTQCYFQIHLGLLFEIYSRYDPIRSKAVLTTFPVVPALSMPHATQIDVVNSFQLAVNTIYVLNIYLFCIFFAVVRLSQGKFFQTIAGKN